MKSLKLSKSLVGIIVVTCVLLMVVLHLQVTDSQHEQTSRQQNKLRFSTTVVDSLSSTNKQQPQDFSNVAGSTPHPIPTLEGESGSSAEAAEAERRAAAIQEEQVPPLIATDSLDERLRDTSSSAGDVHQESGGESDLRQDNADTHSDITKAAAAPAVVAADQLNQPPLEASDLSNTANDATDGKDSSKSVEAPLYDAPAANVVTSEVNVPSNTIQPQLTTKSDPMSIASPASSDIPLVSELPQQPVIVPREKFKNAIVTVDETVFSDLIQLYEDRLIDSDILDFNHDRSVKVMDPSYIDVVYSFHHALKKGDYCSARRPKSLASTGSYSYSRSSYSTEDSMVTALKAVTKSQGIEYLVEYISKNSMSSKSLVNRLTKHLPQLPIISMIHNQITGYDSSPFSSSTTSSTSDESSCSSEGSQATDTSSRRNVFKVFDSLTPYVTNDGGGRNCVQILESLSFYIHELLPFEFEQVLRDVLCQCRYTVLPTRLPDLPYFANWDSVQALIEAASTGANKRCDLSIYDGSGDFQAIKYDSVIVSQNVTFPNDTSPQSIAASGKLLVSDFHDMILDSSSKLNIAMEVANYFEMLDMPNGEMQSFDYLQDLAWNGSFLINMSAPLDLSLHSYKKYQSITAYPGVKSVRKLRTAASLASDSLDSKVSGLDVLTPPPALDGASTSAVVDKISTSTIDAPSNYQIESTSSTFSTASNSSESSASSSSAGFASTSTSSTLVLQFPELNSLLSTNGTDIQPPISIETHKSENDTTLVTSNRRRLYSYSSSTSSSSGDKDALGTDSVNFAWILPNDDSKDALEIDDAVDLDLDGKLVGGIKEAMKYLSTDPSQQSLIESMTKDSSKYYITKDSRKLHALLYREENFAYHQWMYYLQVNRGDVLTGSRKGKKIIDEFTAPSTKLIYLYGQRMSLLSVKLSKMIAGRRRSMSSTGNEAMIVTMASDWKSAMTQYRLSKLMNIGNNVITAPQWSIGMITALLGSPERADIALFESDILMKIVSIVYDYLVEKTELEGLESIPCETHLLRQLFSILLSTSKLSYIKFTAPHITQTLLHVVAPQCANEWISVIEDPLNFLEDVAAELKFHANVTIQEMEAPCSWKNQCLKVDDATAATHTMMSDNMMLYRFAIRKVLDESISPAVTSTDSMLNHQRFDSKVAEVYQKFWQKSSKLGLSMYSAVWLGLLTEQKKRLLELIVNLPMWKAQGSTFEETLAYLSAWNVYLQISSGNSLNKRSSTSSSSSASGNRGKLTEMNKEEPQFWRIMIHDDSQVIPSSSSMGSLKTKSVFPLGITTASKSLDLSNEMAIGKSLWSLLQTEFIEHSAELANGKFSFVEHDSGNGYISSRLALDYPQATVISIERDEYYTSLHNRVVEMLNISNNAVCLKKGMEDESIFRNIYECPELFRFQLLFRNVLQGFKEAPTLDSWGEMMGMALSTALTSFVYVPNRSLVSWGLYMLYGPIYLYGTQGTSDGGTGKDAVHFMRSPGSYRALFDAVGCNFDNDVRGSRENIGYSKRRRSSREEAFIDHYRELSSLGSHPQKPFNNFPSDWLLSTARAKDGSTSLLISPMSANNGNTDGEGEHSTANHDASAAVRYRGQVINIHRPFLEFPLVRCDIVNMTRHVHHHFDYKKDGHSRTYTMHVDVNQTLTTEIEESLGHDISKAISLVDETGVHLRSKDNYYKTTTLPLGHHPSQHNAVSVRLYRDKDSWPIPYVSIYGITLISALRLGLNNQQRDRFFHSFLQLPLYEDMAPWNIVLMGPKLDYIDYDTREFTFNADIPKAYKVMSVLMNYKRTVEDFKKCGSKASTVYGLPFVSDCVGNSDLNLKCDDLAYPVPCSDGVCHSDYISCLRSLADIAKQLTDRQLQQRREGNSNEAYFEHVSQNLASAMNAVVAKFNETSYAKLTYEDFLAHQLK